MLISSPSPQGSSKPIKRDQYLNWIRDLAQWSHAVTLTFSKSKEGFPTSEKEVLRRCRLFLSRLNSKIYGRHGVRRKGHRIGSIAFLGNGVYGDHPHVHWILTSPREYHHNDYSALLCHIASTTAGIAPQMKIEEYRGCKWINYLLDHGFEAWQAQLTRTPKFPQN